jgi:hypothetical protein
MSPQTALLELNLKRPNAVLSQAAGMMIRTIARAMILNVEPALFTRAIQRVGNEAMTLWISMRKTVSRKTCTNISTIKHTSHYSVDHT